MDSSKNISSRIIISAVNFSEGGPLTILDNAIEHLINQKNDDTELVALVHSKNKLQHHKGIRFIELPWVKKSWINRIFFEYFKSYQLSLKLKPNVWICLHDMTANVSSDFRYVYCHNPSIFYKGPLRQYFFDMSFFLFKNLYHLIYRININKNDWVFVQQDWMRKEFKKLFPKAKIAVSQPIQTIKKSSQSSFNHAKNTGPYCIFYPTFPRTFKNIEILIEALNLIEDQGFSKQEICLNLTISGRENRYARNIFNMARGNSLINFLGLQNKEEMNDLYSNCDLVVFPSYLETWGLPISEAKEYKKELMLADLPYAYEAIGEYNKCLFFNPGDANELSSKIIKAYRNENIFYQTKSKNYDYPYLENWEKTINFILKESKLI